MRLSCLAGRFGFSEFVGGWLLTCGVICFDWFVLVMVIVLPSCCAGLLCWLFVDCGLGIVNSVVVLGSLCLFCCLLVDNGCCFDLCWCCRFGFVVSIVVLLVIAVDCGYLVGCGC